LAWTAPLILESAAAATAGCSPCPCTTNYSGKWNTNAAGLCTAVQGDPESAGPNGIDPPCGNVTGGASSYQTGKLASNGGNLQVNSCSSTSITFSLTCQGRFYGAKVKGGATCTETLAGPCDTTITLSIPSNLSHLVLYWCCC
jgi:hypothetical protein